MAQNAREVRLDRRLRVEPHVRQPLTKGPIRLAYVSVVPQILGISHPRRDHGNVVAIKQTILYQQRLKLTKQKAALLRHRAPRVHKSFVDRIGERLKVEPEHAVITERIDLTRPSTGRCHDEQAFITAGGTEIGDVFPELIGPECVSHRLQLKPVCE